MKRGEDLRARYAEYLAACNERRWDDLGKHLATDLRVNGQMRSRARYVSDVQATIAVFPNYQWHLVRALCEGDWLAVHLWDTATRHHEFMGAPGDGLRVETDEFNMYRFHNDLIVEVEGTADNARLAR